ncbi:hypothetical protein ACFRNT_11300 [Streptomyces sp. NPDC056697]
MNHFINAIVTPFHFIADHPIFFGVAAVAIALLAFAGPRGK